MENVNQLVKEIRESLTEKKTSSQKDEIRVMKAMLNDKEYEVGIYGKDGLEGTVNPSKEARSVIASAMAGAAKIPQAEADKLADEYEFKKAEAVSMINISKEYINTYLGTGRKLPMGVRETSNVALIRKHIEEKESNYPKKVGINDEGKPIYKIESTTIKEHDSVKVISSCPLHLK